MKEDNVNSPSHYNSGKIEVIEFIEDQKLSYHSGNAVKYISRAGKKDPEKHLEDIKKGAWYLNREVENLEAKKEGRDPVRPNDMNKRPESLIPQSQDLDSTNSNKIDRFIVRTVEHIHRVQVNMVFLVTNHFQTLGLSRKEIQTLMHNVMKHDQSKFSVAQFEAYIELTEYYRQKRLDNKAYEYTEEGKHAVDLAVTNHYRSENHHPERFIRDDGKIEAGIYTKEEAIETVCDLQAMAQEFGEGTCRRYLDEVWWPEHNKYFSDDYNWGMVKGWMSDAANCFEK